MLNAKRPQRFALGSPDRMTDSSNAQMPSPDRPTAPVTVVCSNTSNNCLGRALLLADLLKQSTSVKVIGVRFLDEHWAPAEASDVPILDIPLRSATGYSRSARWYREQLRGSKVIVSKPLYTSLGLVRRAGVEPSELLLDIDDWEVGLFKTDRPFANFWDFVRVGKLNSYWSMLQLDRSIPKYPHRLVSNRWLEQRYGGTLVTHVRNTDVLKPDASLRASARQELAMGERFWVAFVGTIRKHKGIDDLIAAVAPLGSGVGLFLAGVDKNDDYTREIAALAETTLGKDRLRIVESFPLAALPRWLSAADVVCIPSRNRDGAEGQIPAKLFDALSLGMPIIGTAVNDIEQVLSGAGLVVPPQDPVALGAAIERLRANAQLREELGKAARERAVQQFGYRAATSTVLQALDALPIVR
jgi:glycosyltransferase involved in cell wall biosynthesis